MRPELPLLIGHRGAARHAPENTVAGIRVAADQGARWVEVDVKLTRDLVPILMHDDTLDRTTDGRGPVADADWAMIEDLEAGSSFDRSFAGEPVPTLDELVDVLIDCHLGLYLEIKPCRGREAETATVALDLLSQYWPEELPPPVIASFSTLSLATALDLVPDWPRSLTFDRRPEDWSAQVERVGASVIAVNNAREPDNAYSVLLETGCAVAVYTVNDADRGRQLLDLGVDSIITDTPQGLLRVLS